MAPPVLKYKNGAFIVVNIPTTYNVPNNTVLFVQGAYLNAVIPAQVFGKSQKDWSDLSAPEQAIITAWVLEVVIPTFNLVDDGIAKTVTLTSQLATYDAYGSNSAGNQFINCKSIVNSKEVSNAVIFQYQPATGDQQSAITGLFTMTAEKLS